ncbi:hypothetical protein C1752_01183 [Acaryochloris thomasi RCC1774]|uniref:Uncharacterized protein n=1 Tax=Acaryochloris thomasi RCC1774 TaxID=1764569 RepID=A0A2W1K1V2_9CYAN|nr:hypothetical protein [Acaryochloris thomasi]PZD74431.1 hypothetical protein C1752_01183 [Acaryochloris thomasi RCC1774]
MTPDAIHELWSLVESTQTNVLLNLDDTTLVQWLIKRLKQKGIQDTAACSTYISSRLPLIRDLASDRNLIYQ